MSTDHGHRCDNCHDHTCTVCGKRELVHCVQDDHCDGHAICRECNEVHVLCGWCMCEDTHRVTCMCRCHALEGADAARDDERDAIDTAADMEVSA